MNTSDWGKKSTDKGLGQTAESQAGTSKGKLTNTKLLAPSLTSASIQKQKTVRRKSLQISSWVEV